MAEKDQKAEPKNAAHGEIPPELLELHEAQEWALATSVPRPKRMGGQS